MNEITAPSKDGDEISLLLDIVTGIQPIDSLSELSTATLSSPIEVAPLHGVSLMGFATAHRYNDIINKLVEIAAERSLRGDNGASDIMMFDTGKLYPQVACSNQIENVELLAS